MAAAAGARDEARAGEGEPSPGAVHCAVQCSAVEEGARPQCTTVLTRALPVCLQSTRVYGSAVHSSGVQLYEVKYCDVVR